MSRLSFERSAITQALIVALRGVNGEISYEALAQQIGTDVATMKASLGSARRILIEEQIFFGVIQGIGLQRLFDINLSVKTRSDIKKIGRATTRGKKVIAAIKEFESLPLVNQRMVTTARLLYENIEGGLKAKPEVEPVVVSRGGPSKIYNLK